MSDLAVDGAPARAPLHVRSRWWRWLLLSAVAVCAASGLIYELALLTLSTSINGGGVVATSLIVTGYIAALGAGALMVKPFLDKPASTFLLIEALLGLVGGVSAMVLYLVFTEQGHSLVALVALTFLIGALVGGEVPLLMTLIQRNRTATATETGSLLATLNAADYLGALVGGLIWPFLLLPTLGIIRGTLASGMINVLAALFVTLVLLRTAMPPAVLRRRVLALVGVLGVLIVLLVASPVIMNSAQQRLYADPVIYSRQTDYQSIVVTEAAGDRRLFLDGGLQYSTRDEHRYTESLVYPAVSEDTETVLVIGGGDGLVAEELLTMDMSVTLVELDPVMIEVASTVLREDNGGALDDPRVEVITDDALTWLRGNDARARHFDAVIVDLPDPDTASLARLYSEEFYTLAQRRLAPGGRMVVQSSSAYSTPDVFWRINATLAASGCPKVLPYHVHVPTFGDWGFTLCGPEGMGLKIPEQAGELEFLNDAVLQAAAHFGEDNRPMAMEPSTLVHPLILEDVRKGYRRPEA